MRSGHPCDESYRCSLDALAARGETEAFIETLQDDERRLLDEDWPGWARASQWWGSFERSAASTWLMLGGRGSGKTRAGAEYVQRLARRPTRIALVAATFADAREVMVEGESGLLSLPCGNRPDWSPARRRLEWQSGAVAHVYSAEASEALRGPQFEAAWCDELAKWPDVEAETNAWDNLQFALRKGERPRQVVTTSPRNVALLRRIVADPQTFVSRMRTDENEAMLAAPFLAQVSRYRGTRLGRQELDGELIEDREDALWRRDDLDAHRLCEAPPCERVVVGVDPPVTSHAKSDACGIVVAGLSGERAFVLADRTVERASPARWAEAVVRAYETYRADRVVVEVNQGGDMVDAVLRGAGANLPIRTVRATRGKAVRTEPVAALYERGLVAHVGALERLEDEMCDFGHDGLSNGRSPDRMDALVWALTDLMLTTKAEPRAHIV